MGGILNEKNVNEIKAKAICGCANNQLLKDEIGDLLFQKKILYAPDFVVNAGGLITVFFEIGKQKYDEATIRKKISEIYDHLLFLFSESKREGIYLRKWL